MNIRPATADDCKNLWGKVAPVSVRAFAAEKNGETLIIAGVAYIGGNIVAFSDQKYATKQYPMTAMKMVQKVTGLLREIGAVVQATPDENQPNARNFLMHIGFKQVDADKFIWSN